jgi:TonB-linked SusC/RagA family outer membrane protein
MYSGLRKNKKFLGSVFLLLALSLLSFTGKAAISNTSQDIISGLVVGADGNALEGVQVRNLKTNAITVTVSGGTFEISGDPGDELEFKLIGYGTMVITASEAKRVVLTPVETGLSEVVVVGYGTQKKQNLTGAVSSVNFNENTISRPTFNLSSTLTGLVSGLNISQSSATPGAEGFNILVRGQGTMNDASPLVLIDGVPGALNSIPPYDVESVTVLKDASSSSIYGSRAANGVILVTTKKGSDAKMKVSYNTYMGEQSIAKNISFITDMATHMRLVNESEGFEKYSSDLIQTWETESKAGNPLYPNTDWYDEMLNPSFLQQHNLSLRGGAQKINYYMSLGYLDNKGVIDNSGFKSYSFRLNSEARPTKWLSIGERISGSWSNRAPIDVSTFFGSIRNTTPGVIPKYTDGRYGGEMFNGLPEGTNPRAYVDNIRGDFEEQNLDLQLFGTISFLKYFKWENNFGINYRNRRNWIYARPYSLWNFQTDFEYPLRPNVSNLFNGSTRNYTTVYNSLLRFNESFTGGHNISALLGFDEEYNRMDAFDARKDDILGDDVIYILDAGTNMVAIDGSGTDDALRSYFGRINYDFKNKYLFEANARYDGSSRFSSNNRWGFFPSFSAGWRILEEPFAHSLNKIFNNVKLRGSWGTLGNNRIGDYTYQVTYGPVLYPFGGQLQQSVAPKDLANKNIKWETTRITNIGLDLGMMNNRLSLNIDYFDKVTSDILTRIPVPIVMGNFLPPWQNIAKMQNTGVELQVTYHDKIGEKVSYGINGNVSTVNNKVLEFNGNKSISGPNITSEGNSFNSFYLLEFDHIIQDQSEIDKLLSDGYTFGTYVGGKSGPGDILYKDTNGDKVFDDKDRVIKNFSPLPKFIYGLNLNVAFKGFDLNVMGQGVGGVEGYWGNDGFNTFNINEGFLQRSVILNRWTPENKSTKYPRLRTSGSAINTVNSDYWLYNTSYFRIKSLQLGYTLPEALITKARISDLRIYTELENYFTFTKFSGYNPENTSMNYPLMKQLVFGLNLTF